MTDSEQSNENSDKKKLENAKKYFLLRFSSYFDSDISLLENRTTSYRILINEMITVYDEMISARNDVEKSRLKTAFKYLLEELNGYLDRNPVFKMEQWNREFSQIHKMMKLFIGTKNKGKTSQQDEIKEYGKVEEELLYKLITSLRSLLKKISSKTFVESHFDLILEQRSSLSFDKIDLIVHSLFNELLVAHSTAFLKRDLKKSMELFKSDSLDTQLLELREKYLKSKFKEKRYEFMVRLIVAEEMDAKLNLQQETLLISKEKFEQLKIKIENQEGLEHLFPETAITYLLHQEVLAADDYKASEILEAGINRFTEAYHLLGYKKDITRGNKGLHRVEKRSWFFGDLFVTRKMPTIYKTQREADDIKSFIALRNSRLGRSEAGEFLMERAYSLININSTMTQENQLLNVWLALEHVVALYNKESIIERLRQIVPKVVSLYYIKQKMNEAWLELNRLPSKDEYVVELIAACKKEEGWKYKKIEFASRLCEKDAVTKLIEAIQHDISLERRLKELNGLLCDAEQRRDKVGKIHQSVTNDLNRIYRVRNKIVHSGVNIPDNIAIITARLINYNQRLLGTIVHYMNKSEEITLEEVLNSIVETYNWYTAENIQNLEDIVTPSYLYL